MSIKEAQDSEGARDATIHGPDDATTIRATPEAAQQHKAPAGFSLIPTQNLKRLESELNDLRSRSNPHHTELTLKLNTTTNELRKREHTITTLADSIAMYQGTLENERRLRRSQKEEIKQLKSLIARPFKWFYLTLMNRAIGAERRDIAERTQAHIMASQAAQETIQSLAALPPERQSRKDLIQ